MFRKFPLTTKLDRIVHCLTAYISREISVAAKKIKYVPICTHKKNWSSMYFYHNLCLFGRSDWGGDIMPVNSGEVDLRTIQNIFFFCALWKYCFVCSNFFISMNRVLCVQISLFQWTVFCVFKFLISMNRVLCVQISLFQWSCLQKCCSNDCQQILCFCQL